jgi:hypothetical protein
MQRAIVINQQPRLRKFKKLFYRGGEALLPFPSFHFQKVLFRIYFAKEGAKVQRRLATCLLEDSKI